MSDTYLTKILAGGNLLKQLQVHADEYLGPCGQSQSALKANQIKRNTLLAAKAEIEWLTRERNEVLLALRCPTCHGSGVDRVAVEGAEVPCRHCAAWRLKGGEE